VGLWAAFVLVRSVEAPETPAGWVAGTGTVEGWSVFVAAEADPLRPPPPWSGVRGPMLTALVQSSDVALSAAWNAGRESDRGGQEGSGQPCAPAAVDGAGPGTGTGRRVVHLPAPHPAGRRARRLAGRGAPRPGRSGRGRVRRPGVLPVRRRNRRTVHRRGLHRDRVLPRPLAAHRRRDVPVDPDPGPATAREASAPAASSIHRSSGVAEPSGTAIRSAP
jgi:hypothetical protein